MKRCAIVLPMFALLFSSAVWAAPTRARETAVRRCEGREARPSHPAEPQTHQNQEHLSDLRSSGSTSRSGGGIEHALGRDKSFGVGVEELSRAMPLNKENNAHHGVMGSEIVTLRLESGKQVRGIFKAVDGERNWGEYKAGTLYQREIAAYRLSDALEFNLVPPTVKMRIDGRVGSLQLFVEDATVANSVPNKSGLDPVKQDFMNTLDRIIVNHDRHGGNWLVQEKGGVQEPIGIDHGLSFPPGKRAVNRGGLNMRAETKALLEKADLKKVAQALVETGLDASAVAGALSRIEDLRAGGGGRPRATDAEIDAFVAAAH